MARFNALRDALEEDTFLGGGPMGDAEADPTVVDYGDTMMARASGLRARPPIAANWREREAERLAREKLDAERLVPSTDMLSRVAERSRDPSMRLIPVKNAPSGSDVSAATTSTLPATTDKQPAGKPNSDGAPNLPAPSSEGAGGDSSERDLYLARLAAQNAAGFGGMGAGKNIDMGIADTLGERLKQVQALRAKREEKELGDAEERSNLNAAIDSYKQLFPDQADALERMRGSTNKPTVLREQLNAWRQKMEWEKGKLPVAQATVEQKEAGRDLTRAKIPEVGLEGESKRLKREQDIALGWARFNAQSAAAAAKAAKDVAASGVSRGEQKEVDGQLENIQKIVKAGGYTPMLAALQQADEAIASLGSAPAMAAQAKHALPGGDRFLSPKEKAYYTAVDKLKQMEQLAISGKVVSEPERAEFVRQYGTSWYSDPKAAAAYIELLRSKTANQLNMDLASVRASPAGQKALSAYEQAGGVTPTHHIFKGASVGAGRPAKPTTAPAGKTVLWSVAEKKWKAVPTENADAAVTSGKYER